MLALDAGAYASRWRHRHPGEKALLSLGLLVVTVALPPWPGALFCGVAALALLLGPARVGARIVWRVVRIPLGFILAGAVPLLVAVGGDPWLALDPAGLRPAAELVGRAIAALLCLVLFAATTPLADVVPRLHRLGVPPAVTEIAGIVYRLLFQLLESVRVVREAQAIRLGFRTWRTTYRSLAGQGAAIFVRAFDRARRLEQGLAARGYDGELRVQVAAQPVSRAFVAATLVLLAGIVALTLLVVRA
ncbi:cobalt/nickel transport system permease protein [Pseudonocardia thermophila]|uniref:Cobalt/nickel transport system permease protein n=1 Tax=Pseudonocardia thermophila TaxID=1848 RepID=A0A1M6QBN3_PSETH|nr:cobalt ECF transporter T component CbiQ [Pseudonocardia thermophila]SHK17689.1 cobalt/nickel transport system permease protein [Pseudonocardia thermophila]